MDSITSFFEGSSLTNILALLAALLAGARMFFVMQSKIEELKREHEESKEQGLKRHEELKDQTDRKYDELKAQTDSLMAWRLQMAESIGRIEAKLDMVIRAFDRS